MKKNRMMRLASLLLVLVLMTTSVISGTFAKYTTSVTSNDSARVAKWGFTTASIDFENLFNKAYTNVADGTDDMAIIAPGTEGEVSFKFENTLEAGPEVAYTFIVDTEGSSCAEAIQNNGNITWALVKSADKATATYGTWEQMIAAIQALDEDKSYGVGEIPAMVDTEYTILWKWTYNNANDGNDDDNYNDSDLGNTAVAEDLIATLKITITATQVD